MASNYLNTVSDSDFESKVLACEQPVLLQFWAAWCFPSQLLTTTIEALANEYHGRVMVGNVDAESGRNIAKQLDVSVLPTVLVLNKGEVVKRFQGTRGRREYARFLDSLLTLNLQKSDTLDHSSMRR